MRTVVRRCGKLWSLSEKISVNNEAKTKVSKLYFEKGQVELCDCQNTHFAVVAAIPCLPVEACVIGSCGISRKIQFASSVSLVHVGACWRGVSQ